MATFFHTILQDLQRRFLLDHKEPEEEEQANEIDKAKQDSVGELSEFYHSYPSEEVTQN